MYSRVISVLRGDFNSVRSRFYYYPRDLLHYILLYRLRGKSLIDFQADKIDKVEEVRNNQAQIKEEESKKLKLACKEIFKTQNGVYFGKFLYAICNTGQDDTDINPNKLTYYKGAKDIYEAVKEHLTETARINIEIKE